MKKISVEAAKVAHVYLVKEGIYLNERQFEQVALAVEEEMSPLYEASLCAKQRMETIRETNPEIALDAEIDALCAILESANVRVVAPPSEGEASNLGSESNPQRQPDSERDGGCSPTPCSPS